jgi:hypothetical protein
MRALTIFAICALAVPACAATTPGKGSPTAGRTCVLARQVESFAAQGIDVVNIRDVRGAYFRLSLAEACPEIQESDRIQLISRGGGSFICTDEAANSTVIAYSKVTGPRRCLVKVMDKLTPEQVAGLGKNEKP